MLHEIVLLKDISYNYGEIKNETEFWRGQILPYKEFVKELLSAEFQSPNQVEYPLKIWWNDWLWI